MLLRALSGEVCLTEEYSIDKSIFLATLIAALVAIISYGTPDGYWLKVILWVLTLGGANLDLTDDTDNPDNIADDTTDDPGAGKDGLIDIRD